MKQFLFAIALIVLMYCSLPAFPTSIEVSGDVSGVWNVDTVKVTGNINIREVESLYIQPGVKVIHQFSAIAGLSMAKPFTKTRCSNTEGRFASGISRKWRSAIANSRITKPWTKVALFI